jgi:Glycosyl transferase family 2
MKIHLYTIAWNDIAILPFYLAYYGDWVDRIIVYDDGSDDGSLDLFRAHPKVDLRAFPAKRDSFVLTANELWDRAWSASRNIADWVVIANIDEFFWHRDGMRTYLSNCTENRITVVKPLGYEMVGDAFPPVGADLLRSLPLGVPMWGLDKQQIFNPSAISDMDFGVGRHVSSPVGRVKVSDPPEAKLLHYKYIDMTGYHNPRQDALKARLLKGDRDRGYGSHYNATAQERMRSFHWLKNHAARVVDA